MKYLTEFRDDKRVKFLLAQINQNINQSWKIMEICGGQTHAIAKYGLMDLLPKSIELIHGPGCPVCVTSKPILDTAMELSRDPNIIFCTFADMLRVPGTNNDLMFSKSQGADIRMIYSPLEAITIAQQNPSKEIVLFAVGFETTAPTHAKAVLLANKLQLNNFSIITSIVLVPPAMEFILQSANNLVQGFLAAGHVCSIMGDSQYHPIANKYKVPVIITGFEPVDILQGILSCVQQLEAGTNIVENKYQRIVAAEGNIQAQKVLEQVFYIADTLWRGIGIIPNSGMKLKPQFNKFDALSKFNIKTNTKADSNSQCISGLILQGQQKPNQCKLFGKTCTPERPIGAPMVSAEGACRAYYLYKFD